MEIKELKQVIEICEQSSLNYFKFSKAQAIVVFNRSADTEGINNSSKEELPYEENQLYINSEQPKEEQSAKQESCQEEYVAIKSNCVGIISLSDKLKSKTLPISVEKEDVLATIEAMKIYNDINANKKGYIEKILFVEGEVVDYGQELFWIRMVQDEI